MIGFNLPYKAKNEEKYIRQALESRNLSGDYAFTRKCVAYLQEKYAMEKSLLTTSCSSALDMAMLVIDLQPGDEVIMPSFNFVSAGNSVALRGGKPVFVEVDQNTMTLDLEDVKKKITSRTKAIIPVHYAGVSCDMDGLMDIAKKHNLRVIEDSAQGIHSKYKDRFLGTIGDMGVLSFHETKNIMCGEGGALIIKNQGEYELAEMIREKGTNRGQFLRGEVEKYTWQTVGSSYLSSDLLAALLYAQLEEVEYIHKKRQYLYEKYIEGLTPLANKGLIELPIIPDYATSNYHIFHFWLRDHDTRSHLIQFLKEAGIQATFHYVPLHLSPMGRTFGYTEGMLPVTESSAARLLRLPLYPDLTDESLAYIIGKIEAFLLRRAGDPLWRET